MSRPKRSWRVRWRRVAMVFLPLLGLAALVVVPNLRELRKSGNEVAAIGVLKQISAAQQLFREADLDQDGVCDYGSLDELVATGVLPEDLVRDPCFGVRAGYVFSVQASTANPEFLWMATASPLEPGVTGDRHFAMNQYGVIYFRPSGRIPLRDDCQPPDDAYAGCCGDHQR